MSTTGFHSCWITSSGDQGESGDAGLLFPYWSFTKTAIAICAVTLARRGIVDLDARLDGQPYTLRQLLNHNAGLPDYGALAEYRRAVAADEEPWPRAQLLDAVLDRGLLFAPGQGWSYSNVGYMLARQHIEAASGQGFAQLFEETVGRPLGLESVELAATRERFSRVCWSAAARYHPGWVYHGCLIGNARDAALLLHGLFAGRLLPPDSLTEMLARRAVGRAIEGRPWTDCGYALGLMSGRMADGGRAIGHSGAGPFCVNAVYHFPDVDDPVTVASFTSGADEGQAEFEALRLARAR